LQKYFRPGELGAVRFANIGFSNPEFWAQFTGFFEITCGIMILLGFLTRLACIPLFIIIMVAFVTTKMQILTGHGFWPFAHEYRTDFAVTLLLILLFRFGAGGNSIDFKLFSLKSISHEREGNS
jgi:putative oxidoreductase